jgi:hypothetical protein
MVPPVLIITGRYLPAAKKMPGSSPGMMKIEEERGRCCSLLPLLIITGLDPVILFGGPEEDARVKPGHDEV